ncbi:ICOS ligand-like [Polypterus senegalus]|uniref:ICOS ligand-like n=1 Tax=Polypterus senegalus TaxID=55291 RepID=UPI0019625196|nr:ICOS ligand-like [Polypterus senegalus]
MVTLALHRLGFFFILFLPSECREDRVQIGSGENALLKCIHRQEVDLQKLVVSWRTSTDLPIYRYSNGKEEAVDRRAKLSTDDMKQGNFSLTLSNVTPEDSGLYECYVRISNKQKGVQSVNLLVVDSVKPKPSDGSSAQSRTEDLNNGGMTHVMTITLIFPVLLLSCLSHL